jgi:hypothetical protein
MNVPKAFYTRRVGEALESLALHVTSARNIAASLKPIKTAELDLVEEEAPRAVLNSITPSRIDPSKVPEDGVKFTISGKNLTEDKVKGFELFLEEDPSVSFPDNPATVTQVNDRELTTDPVDLSEAPSGLYEVRITDENDTPHLPGFIVEVEADGAEPTSGVPPTITGLKRTTTEHTVILKVDATGTGPLSYQWLKNGRAIPNATKDHLQIRLQAKNKGNYSVVVANAAGFAVSDVVNIDF